MTGSAKHRYAWVLSGRYDTKAQDSRSRPRSEFEEFVARNGGVLLSRSLLDGTKSVLARALARTHLPLFALASIVQSRAGEFDAFICSGEDIGVPLAIASLGGTVPVPIHMMFHGHHLDSQKLRILAPLLRRMSHVHFHCLSQSLRARTMAVLGVPPERCHATGYGVDTTYFAPIAAQLPTLVASAGAANRDYSTLAAAVRDLPIEVRIAADSNWVPTTAATAEIGWPDNVHARSYGTYAKVRELYGAAGFIVVPLHPASHACGYSVIAEAMAMGRAVIATRTDAPPDFLLDGETGFFVAPHDTAGLQDCIRRLLANPTDARMMGERARALMVGQYSLAHYCERLERIVTASLHRRDSAREQRNFAANSTQASGAR